MKACENCQFCVCGATNRSKYGFYQIECSKNGRGWSDNVCKNYKPAGV